MIVVVVGLLLTGGIAAMVWRYWVASPDESDALGRLLLLGVFAAACAGAVWGFPFSGRVRACLVLGGCAVLAPYVLVVAAAVDARTTRARGLSTGLSTDDSRSWAIDGAIDGCGAPTSHVRDYAVGAIDSGSSRTRDAVRRRGRVGCCARLRSGESGFRSGDVRNRQACGHPVSDARAVPANW